METNPHYTLVGIFVIVLVAFIVLAVTWLSVGFTFESYTQYKIYMNEPVTGLTLDMPVQFNGVVVGKIKEIKINPKNPELVEILLKIKSSTPVTQGTTATLSLQGISGLTYISLEDKGNNRTPLHVESGQRYAVIKTKPSILIRLDTLLSQVSSSINKMNDSFTSMSNNFGNISTTIGSLLNKENLKSVKNILHSGQGTIHVIETQMLPNVHQTINNLNNLTRELSETAAEIKQNPAVIIRGKQQQELGPGE